MKNKFTCLILLVIIPILSIGQVSFTTESVSVPGEDLGFVDMNNDQLDDLIGITSSLIQIHYQQENGTYTEVSYPISGLYSPSWSMAVGDFDANGFNDFVWGSTSGVNVLKANETGTDWTVAASSNSVFTQRTNFVDINNDGHLDVFVCDDVEPNEYFINDGNGNLTLFEGADPNGVPEGLGLYPTGGNYGSVWIDYDNDRDIDMFLAKCGGEQARRVNELFRNNGNSSFTEVGAAAGLADPIQTWSSAWGDYDNDGDMDCFVGSSDSNEEHKLMRNNGDGTFTDVSIDSGVMASQEFYHEQMFIDFDNDGWLDIFVNGDILYNDGDGTFTLDPRSSTGLSGFGGAFGDYNNDGFMDLFRTNVSLNGGNSNNWLKIATVGVQSNRNGIGARIEINTPSGNQIRDIRSGEGFKYMSTMNAHFGIGTDTQINTITVYWPSGTVDLITNPDINTCLLITEGETLSLQDTLVDDLIIYPNPTKGVLNLNTTNGFENAIFSVFDMTGKRVLNSKLSANMIDVTELSVGTYILRIMDKGKIKTQKFIKE